MKMVADFQNVFNIQVEVVTLDRSDDPWIGDFPARVHALGPVHGTYGLSPKLVNWLKSNLPNFDLAVVNGVWTYVTFAVREASLSCSTPYVLFTDGMLDPWFARYKLKHLKKCIYWKLFEHKVVRDAAAVFFTSEHERTGARSAFTPYRAREIVTPYGTQDPLKDLGNHKRTFENNYPQLKGTRYLLFLSRLHEKKGVDILLKVFSDVCKDFPDVNLVLAGPVAESFKARLEEITESLPQEVNGRIIKLGLIKGADKWGALACAEAMILPSHQENFARVVAESLSCSTPVLITNRVNIWEAIERHGAGVVETDTDEGVRKMLLHWLTLPAEDRLDARSKARQCFEHNFDANNTFARYLESLDSIVIKP